MNKSRRLREGFSLIEVIVAVAILAILSVPILLYFTNSAIHTAHGKFEQSADLAAQSIVEEVDAAKDLDTIEEVFGQLKDESGNRIWKVGSHAELSDPLSSKRVRTGVTDTTPDNLKGATLLSRNISVNGSDYVAQVQINYNDPVYVKDGEFASASADYNNYKNPHMSDLYSDSSIVIAEGSDVGDTAYSDLYFQLNGSPRVNPIGSDFASDSPAVATFVSECSMSTIVNNTKRVFVLSVVEEPTGSMFTSSDMLVVRAGYRFDYKPEGFTTPSASTTITLENTKIEKEKLKDIYFMFQPVWSYSDYALSEVADSEGGSSYVPITESAELDLSGIDWDYSSVDADHQFGTKEKASISFIKQDIEPPLTADETTRTLYQKKNNLQYTINFHDPSGASSPFDTNKVRFYSNGSVRLPDAFNYDKYTGTFGTDVPSLVKKTYDKRIARITVNVFDKKLLNNDSGVPMTFDSTDALEEYLANLGIEGKEEAKVVFTKSI